MTNANTMVERLETILSDFDTEVAEHIGNETERADLWDEVEIPVMFLREIAALIRSLAAERNEETDESLWRFWNAKARTLAEENAALRKVLSEEGLTVNYQVDAVTKQLEAAKAENEHDAKTIHRLQAALSYWMPSITEIIEIELYGKAGDDAYLLAGFTGDVPMPSWGDRAIARYKAAEAEIAVLREALEPFAEAVEDWHEMGESRPISPWTSITVGHLRRARAAGRREG
ncbi:MAG TPA: hypothetical protein VHP34_11405 [Alphaproteobacteria bacterium]|nr:hypothetical protein [Alphaproteobacteria bacterium]